MLVVGVKAVRVNGRITRHEFHAAADHHVLMARQNAHRGERHGLLATAAETVQRHAGGGERPTGIERRHARDVVRMITAAGAAPGDHVLDVGRIESHAIAQRVQHLRHAPLGMDVRQAADPGFAAAAG